MKETELKSYAMPSLALSTDKCTEPRNSTASVPPAAKSQRLNPHAARTPEEMGIFRYYSERCADYYRQVILTRNGKTYRKSFYEKRCGGEQAALTLAQAWRDRILAEHQRMSLAQFCSVLRNNNTSGVTGVYRRDRMKREKNGKAYPYVAWEARIPLGNGKTQTRSFLVKTYGEEGAKQRAIEARQQGLAALEHIALREHLQPQPVSTAEDIALLQAHLRIPHEQRERKAAARQARQMQAARRVAQKQAEAQAALQQALQTPNRSGEPYVTRYENESGRGGYYRVIFERQRQRYSKVFSDREYGSAQVALEAAKVWRDQTFQSLPVVSKAQAVTNMRAANTSGVVGVHRIHETRNGKRKEWWRAQSPNQPGQPHRNKRFSIEKYGERQAFELAVKARAAYVAELADVPHLPKNAAKQMMHALNKASQASSSGRSGPGSQPAGAGQHAVSEAAETSRLAAAGDTAKLLDVLKEKVGAASDYALSRALNLTPPVISKLRNGRLAVDLDLLNLLHRATGMEVQAMKDALGAAWTGTTPHQKIKARSRDRSAKGYLENR